MIYSFMIDGDREVIDCSHVFYTEPEKHPTRLLDFHDILYLVDGRWNILIEKEELQIGPGDVVVVPAGLHHYGDWLCSPNTKIMYVHFRVKKGDGPQIGDEETLKLPVPCLTHVDNTQIYSILQDILKTFHSNLPYRGLRCSALLSLILCELSNQYTKAKTKQDKQILDIIEYMQEHSTHFFTIDELAVEAGLSPKSLTSRFKAETGQSIHKYQMNRKLEQIALMLQYNSHTSLKNMAYNFGFYDEFHLSSCFKKKFGVSPSNYGR
jgi:AraC-like DNA-binding protein